jgi:hypothetical protein
MEILDSVARRYGVRPSALLGVTDEFEAFSIDLWAHNWGAQRDEQLRREAVRKAHGGH